MDEYIGQHRRFYNEEGGKDGDYPAFTVMRKRPAGVMFAGEYELVDDGYPYPEERTGIASARELEKYTYIVEED